ncbi:DNA polymerase IV [Mesosutterella sp. OilRF-GAM-744-9]|uniref:DNA polymerase IV n=1 Tax=Mesosutterella porci TaxID=2915351 RepID=A0ABS9MPV2_9BURK|nr:DNA polymerase IV [Mesosutterella sp. oilRF-744-WT-GAM-9]MCG5030427.1 DNA polymerase IV [Mesosutterella sp. oilRF-744-WT-GAM-9]
MKRPYRKIIHIDMDAFYASVEQLDHPELRGRPIAVGRGEGRSVVATASYEARAFGVHSAMPSFKAKALCPELVFVRPRMERYRQVSESVRAIFRRYTELVEPISIDEAFLDVSEGRLSGPEAAAAIKQDIRRELHLVASAGVSFNKFLAKVASDWNKPDGFFVIRPEDAVEFIAALPIEDFWGVGPVTATKMREAGIETGADLRKWSLGALVQVFGAAGESCYRFSRGIDERPVTPVHVRRSVGSETTLESNAVTLEEVLRELEPVELSLMRRLARSGFLGSTLTLKLKLPDFRGVTRSKSLGHPLQSPQEIRRLTRELAAEVRLPAAGVRLVGLSVSRGDRDEQLEAGASQLELGLSEGGSEPAP